MKRSEEFYEGDREEVLSTAGRGETMREVLDRRWNRRGLLRGGAATGMVLTLGVPATWAASQMGTPEAATPGATPVTVAVTPTPTPEPPPTFATGFQPIALDEGQELVVAANHVAIPFLRWGDPIFAGAPEWDIANQSASSQEQQFGYNCDWIGFLSLPIGSGTSDHGLLVVNHEYTNSELMFPGYLTANPDYSETPVATPEATPGLESATPVAPGATPVASGEPVEIPEFLINTSQEIVDVELAAHGLSVVEISRNESGQWEVVLDSEYNRRITATTPMEVTGPAAGIDLLKTSEDATGTMVLGTLNNCAGGYTPWGTVLTGEENFQQYFANLALLPVDDPIRVAHERYGLNEGTSDRLWEDYYPRFDVSQEPNEPFRFGWIVEFDPYDPTSTPKKRTALGRNKHEGATAAVAPGGQVAFYSGDDEIFDYAYKFVTAGSYNPDDRAANVDLLDDGTLYVARFDDDGSGEWIPMIHGEGLLTAAYGFASQGEVLAKTRLAADLLGATKMDRPEDFETNPVSGKVYLACTNNTSRDLADTDDANPRPNNFAGHIIEITEDGNDHAATTFSWEIFILAGDASDSGTWYGGSDEVSSFAAPDNIAFDTVGNIWISTDGMPNSLPGNDGLFVAATEGEERGMTRQFFSTVPGAECSGPEFNPDNSALFVAVQHPGEGGTVEEPVSLWPDGAVTARPTVVLITHDDPTAPVGRLT